jgi:hypothetical protein
MNKTLLVLTFDENETYTIKNNVFTILLGDVIPPSLRGTTDNTFYTHYSLLSTIQNNWGLYNLGRGDVAQNFSNVFELVANATGWKNTAVAAADIPYFNFTASGFFDPTSEAPLPAVNETAPGAGGKGILPSLKGANGSAIAVPSSASSTAAGSATGTAATGGATGTAATGTAASASPSGSKSAGVRQFNYSIEGMLGCICAIIAFSIGLVV